MPPDLSEELSSSGITARLIEEGRMDLKELGSRLSDERQRQGLTIEQIMEITKVSRVNINAIESGNRNDFPHEVYAKGFIKTYAKALGLDADEIGEEFSRIMSASENDDMPKVEESTYTEYTPVQKKGSVGIIIAIVALLCVVAGLVYYMQDSSVLNFGKTEQSEVEVVEEVVVNPEPSDASKAPEAIESKASESKEMDQPADDTNSVEETVAVEDTVTTEVAPAEVPQPKQVVITGKSGEVCWLEATVDGESREYIVQEGDSLSLPYHETLKVKLGNAGGVEVVSNGEPYKFDAPKGKVKVLEFPAAQ